MEIQPRQTARRPAPRLPARFQRRSYLFHWLGLEALLLGVRAGISSKLSGRSLSTSSGGETPVPRILQPCRPRNGSSGLNSAFPVTTAVYSAKRHKSNGLTQV